MPRQHTPNTKMKIHLFKFLSFPSETAIYAAATVVVLHITSSLQCMQQSVVTKKC